MEENIKEPKKIQVLVECALCIALSFVLSLIKIPTFWEQGGSITALSLLPLVFLADYRGTKQGILTAFVYSILKLLMGLSNLSYCPTALSIIACILLDYLLPFTAVGLAKACGFGIKNKRARLGVGTAVVMVLKFLCHFVSGIVLWDAYAPAGQPVWIYSLVYNGGYMLIETILTVIGAVLIIPAVEMILSRER